MSWDFNRFINEIDFLANLLSSRMDSIKSSLDISPLVKQLNLGLAYKEVLKKFGSGTIYALGIDGSMSYEDRMEIIVLYIAVSGFKIPIEIDVYGKMTPKFNDLTREDKYTFSTVIPIWMEDLNEILAIRELGVVRSLEAAMESIPFALMTFGEYYMGLRGLKGDIDILFLDRPLASSIHPYRRDARRLIFEDKGGSLANLKIDDTTINLSDIFLGVYAGPFINNKPLFKMPYRGSFKFFSILQFIISNGGSADIKEMSKYYQDINEKSWNKILKIINDLNQLFNNELFYEETLGYKIELRKERLDYWERITKLINYLGNRLFFESNINHPLLISDGKWLSTREINTVTLLTIYEIGRLEAERNKLVIGIGKDTYVTDLHRSVIPFAIHMGLLSSEIKVPIKSDRPLLTLASSLHPETFKTPWRFAGYDGAFATLVKNGEADGEEIPFRAARKVIYPEGIIVRNYFQLRSLHGTRDVKVKSPVFFYDRFQREEDTKYRHNIHAIERGKKVLLNLYFENYDNLIDNMILYILSLLDNPEITEATGHNYLLFMADKDVKAAINTVREMIINAADARINKIIRDRGVFIVTRRFRDFRKIVERRRRR